MEGICASGQFQGLLEIYEVFLMNFFMKFFFRTSRIISFPLECNVSTWRKLLQRFDIIFMIQWVSFTYNEFHITYRGMHEELLTGTWTPYQCLLHWRKNLPLLIWLQRWMSSFELILSRGHDVDSSNLMWGITTLWFLNCKGHSLSGRCTLQFPRY